MASDFRILGDINPKPDDSRNQADEEREFPKRGEHATTETDEKKDEFEHSGSRDVTGGGGAGTETGGTRNYRSGSGATGSDIGQRPE